jgi:hypothetical protein
MAGSEHASGDKVGRRRQVFRIVGAEPAPGDKLGRLVRVCHVLQVDGRLDAGLAGVAAAQDGVAHRRQLNAHGIGRGAVAHRVSSGSLHAVLPSVFAVWHPGLSWRGMLAAALL